MKADGAFPGEPEQIYMHAVQVEMTSPLTIALPHPLSKGMSHSNSQL